MAQHNLIEIHDLKKAYTRGRETVEALRAARLNIAQTLRGE